MYLVSTVFLIGSGTKVGWNK